MNAYGTPPGAVAAARDDRGPFTPDRRDWLRLIGGMMFAAGALVLLIRKDPDWGDWAVFAGLIIPSLLLFAIAFAGRARWGLQGWQAAFLLFATLLLLVALLQLVEATDGDTSDELNLLWTFGVTALVAIISSFVLRAPFQMLVGALLLVVAWLALWAKVLDEPKAETFRWLLLALGVIYLVVGVLLQRARRLQASDLIAVAGFVAVAVGAFNYLLGNSDLGDFTSGHSNPTQAWNVFLLVVSLAFIAYGVRSATRGPAYAGAIGLLAFIYLTGRDVVTRVTGGDPGGVVGWPLILLIGGFVLLALSFVLRPGALGGPGGTTAAPGGGPRPGAQHGREGGYDPVAGAPAGGPADAPTQTLGQPGAGGTGPVYGDQPGAAGQPPPPNQPGQPPPDQPGGLLDQWRSQPPPGPGGPPPQQ